MYRKYLFPVLCLMLMSGLPTLQAQQKEPLPQWTPSPTLTKQLGLPASFEGYLLQPPAHYTLIVPDTGVPEGVKMCVWVGGARKDGTHPLLMVNFIVPPGTPSQNLTLNQVAESLLLEIKKARRDWKQTPATAGTIQGMKFVRIGWTGIDRKEKRAMQGWMMVGRDGDTIIELASQDVVPNAASSLPLAETAARTFKRLSPRVVFSEQWPDHAQIFAMNPDGSDRTCLTPASDTDYHPALSPDGTTIAFTTHRDGVRALYLMNSDGTNQRRVTEKEDAGLCAWSPDGLRLAFSSNRNGRYCIYVMNRDGSQVRRLTEGPSEDCPVWSPDGRQIAYEGREGQIWRIYVVDMDGVSKPITKGRWSDRWPQWSPGGDAIVYTSYEQGKGEIYLMQPDGTSPLRLTTNPAEDRQPSFTADGRQILFHSNRAGSFDIYALDLETLEEHRLTTARKDTSEAITLGRSHLSVPKPPK